MSYSIGFARMEQEEVLPAQLLLSKKVRREKRERREKVEGNGEQKTDGRGEARMRQ